MTDYLGGISRTVNYKGNRIDIGGHRFFSKSDRVMQWWLRSHADASSRRRAATTIRPTRQHGRPGRRRRRARPATRPTASCCCASARAASISSAGSSTIRSSSRRHARASSAWCAWCGSALSYLRGAAVPLPAAREPGGVLHQPLRPRAVPDLLQVATRRRSGACPARQISAEWGAQRIKGLSITKALRHIFRKSSGAAARGDVAQKGTETSLIEQFLYPKLGPGQMWENVAQRSRRARRRGAHAASQVTGLHGRRPARSRRSRPSTAHRRRPRTYRRRLVLLDHAGQGPGRARWHADVPAGRARSQRGPGLPRFHHRRPAGRAS